MAMTRSALTEEDIRTLVRGSSPDDRAVAAHKICRSLDRDGQLSDAEREKAEAIVRLMADDAESLVRRALSVTLKASPLIPREIANRLARDMDSIALPILSFSPVLTDEDLADLVRTSDPVRQVAVARRPMVSEIVASAIVEYGSESAVEAVCANDNARLTSRILERTIDKFPRSDRVLTSISHRTTVPIEIAEKLVSMVSEQVRVHILENHAVSPELALKIAFGVKERATVDLVELSGRSSDARGLASHLHRANRLTPSLVLRSLAHGHMNFFECAMSELAGVPHHRAWLLVHDAGQLGFKALFDRSGIQLKLYPAFRTGIDVFHSLEAEGNVIDRELFRQRMLERFLSRASGVASEDVAYLLDKLDRLSASGISGEDDGADTKEMVAQL
jgi:uncharacterized protein (DUF2336 family)